jgi:hypothetical protein
VDVAWSGSGRASVLAAPGTGEGHAAGDHSHAGAASKRVAFHDEMRALWEEHGSWTRMVIVSFVGSLPNLTAAEQVLLHNQTKIGNAVKPYYGAAAGNRLTRLLKTHILGAVDVPQAARSGDGAIARAVDELHGHYRASARAFGPYIRHILGDGRHDLGRDRQAVPRPVLALTKSSRPVDSLARQWGEACSGRYATPRRSSWSSRCARWSRRWLPARRFRWSEPPT